MIVSFREEGYLHIRGYITQVGSFGIHPLQPYCRSVLLSYPSSPVYTVTLLHYTIIAEFSAACVSTGLIGMDDE